MRINLIFKYILLVSVCFLSAESLFARVETKFDVFEQVHIISDKAYRYGEQEVFEAVGNVVATFQDKAIYGEKLTIDSISGRITVYGSVRYVAAGITMFGSEIVYNSKNGHFVLENGRINASSYVVIGKRIERLPDKSILGIDAEYSTCLDCPESWTVQGSEVRVFIGEYITMKHAYFKSKGVVVMYFPYLKFPIKQERESGLLFPDFSLDFSEGVTYKQPYYQVLGDYNDLTFSPGVWGDNGYGAEAEYRHNLGVRSWLQLNSFGILDRKYTLNKDDESESSNTYARTFSNYEHHFNWGRKLNHHFLYTDAKETDILRDYNDYTEDYFKKDSLGSDLMIDYVDPAFSVSLDASYRNNLLTPSSEKFDDDYVQTLPKISFALPPKSILNTDIPMLKNISAGFDGDITSFRQTERNESTYIRNADRLIATPYLFWNMGMLGPISVSSNLEGNYQRYLFKHRDDEYFEKLDLVSESEMSIKIEKIFGVAYREKVSSKSLNTTKEFKQDKLVGSIPDYTAAKVLSDKYVTKNSYRHGQEFKFKHYYLLNETENGNRQFAEQIKTVDGLFDYHDALRSEVETLGSTNLRTDLPINNTLELVWTNSLIRKSAKAFDVFDDGRFLRDNFDYGQVAYFNVSQGYNIRHNQKDTGSDVEALTRLHVESGISLGNASVTLSDYFFHDINKHMLTFGIGYNTKNLHLDMSYNYNQASDPHDNGINFNFKVRPLDVLILEMGYEFDFEANILTENSFGFLYRPNSRCWSIELKQTTTEIDTKYGVNFLLYFDDKSINKAGEF